MYGYTTTVSKTWDAVKYVNKNRVQWFANNCNVFVQLLAVFIPASQHM